MRMRWKPAKMAGVDFILNMVQNHRKEITASSRETWRRSFEGVKTSREIFEVKVPHAADIVITTPGGYPGTSTLSVPEVDGCRRNGGQGGRDGHPSGGMQ